MTQLIHLLTISLKKSQEGLVILMTLFFVGCQKLKPKEISIPEYPDLQILSEEQANLLNTSQLKKTVYLDEEREEKTFQMDTSKWKKELSFLDELNPNQPEYVGVFEVEEFENVITLKLKEGESGILKNLVIREVEGRYARISGTIHENKDVYIHHKDIEVLFKDGLIDVWNILGYQKVMFNDTVNFKIFGQPID
ncbi:MAG: hypothetical protein AAGC64_11415 [Bacteroidota bacterium]